MLKTKPKHIYGDVRSPSWRGVKVGTLLWGIYHIYSSKSVAETAFHKMSKTWYDWESHKRVRVPWRVVKTVRGWALVQGYPKKGFEVKANAPTVRLIE